MEDLQAVLETGGAAAAELAASTIAARDGRCANCSAPLTGPYCAACGQPADVHRRSVRHLAHELVTDVVSFDSRILRTAKALLLQPGELATSFREGRTQRYVPPVRLYLFVSLIFFVVLSFSGIAIFQIVLTSVPGKVVMDHGQAYIVQPNGQRMAVPVSYDDGKQHYAFNSRIVFFAREGALHAEVAPDAQRRLVEGLEKEAAEARDSGAGVVARAALATIVKLAKDPAALNGALTAWIPRALFLLLPLFALLLAAFYWRQRKSLFFVDHLVFSLGFHSFGFALLLAAAAIAQIVPSGLVAWLTVVVLAAYLLIGMKRFYGQSWARTGAKFATISLLYTCFFVLPAFGGVIAASVIWG